MRMRVLAGVALAAVVGVGGLSGCGGAAAGPTAEVTTTADDYTDLDADGQALEALGMDSGDLTFAALAPGAAAEPTPGASASPSSAEPDRKRKHRPHKRLRLGFGKRAMHGEVVVQTDTGTKTMVAQRGTVTAITGTTVTVRSADGFTLTWTLGGELRVIERRGTIEAKDVAVGTEVGVSGAREGDKPVARFIVVPGKR